MLKKYGLVYLYSALNTSIYRCNLETVKYKHNAKKGTWFMIKTNYVKTHVLRGKVIWFWILFEEYIEFFAKGVTLVLQVCKNV